MNKKILPWEAYENICKHEIKEFTTVGIDVQYYVHIDDEDKKVYLVFEESSSKTDWVINFTFFSTILRNFAIFGRKIYKNQTSPLRAHGGFTKAYRSGKDQIMSEFIEACKSRPGYDVFIMGWSYGGAMSYFASEDYNYRTRTDVNNPDSGFKANVITFGAPMPFKGRKGIKYYKSCVNSVYNFSHVRDIVTVVPPAFIGFKIANRVKMGKKDIDKWYKNLTLWFKPNLCHSRYGIKELYENTYEEDDIITK